MKTSISIRAAAVFSITCVLSGCGTISALSNLGRDTPLVYGGTRLDVAAVNNDQSELAKFEHRPPAYPAADITLSVVGDTIVLPGTLLTAAYRKLFWQ